jgi:hypothetical protein
VGEKQTDFGEPGRNVTSKRRKLKISHILLLLLLIGVVTFTLYRLNLKKKLRARIEAIRTDGYPATLYELDQWYSIPKMAENAADIILDSFDYYNEPADKELPPLIGGAELPARTESLPEDMKTIISKYLNDNQKSIELLHEAASLEYSRYPVDFTLGTGTRIDHLGNLRQSLILLQLEAVYSAENDRQEASIQSINSIFGIARSLNKEPTTVSQLARLTYESQAVKTLECVINKTDFSDEQLVEFSQAFVNAQELSGHGIWRAFAGERCMVMTFFAEPRTLTREMIGRQTLPAPILELYKASGLADKDAIAYLDLMESYININKLPMHERRIAAERISSKRKTTSKIHVILRTFLPSFSGVINCDLRTIAGLRNAQVALAIQRYRLSKGKLPDQLTELVPDYLDSVPRDPYDGKELRYKKLDRGFLVYSIGEDLSDDGGTEIPKTSKEKKEIRNWDITFIVEK